MDVSVARLAEAVVCFHEFIGAVIVCVVAMNG